MSVKSVKEAIRSATTNDPPDNVVGAHIDDAEAKKIVEAATRTAGGKSASLASKGETRLIRDLFSRRYEQPSADQRMTKMLPEFPGKVSMSPGAVKTFQAFLMRSAPLPSSSLPERFHGTWVMKNSEGKPATALDLRADGGWAMTDVGEGDTTPTLKGTASAIRKLVEIYPEAIKLPNAREAEVLCLYEAGGARWPMLALPLDASGSFILAGAGNAAFVKETDGAGQTPTRSLSNYYGTWALRGDDDFKLMLRQDGSWSMSEVEGPDDRGDTMAGQSMVIGKLGKLMPNAPPELENVDAIVLFMDARGAHPVAALPMKADGSFYLPGPEEQTFVRTAS